MPGQVDAGLEYIRRHAEVRDVILSGGDPLMLRDEAIVDVVRRLREIPHVEIIRIGTRVPNALPQRITPALCAALRAYHPIWMMVHFSHPRELTPEAKEACERLADHGFPLMNQTVLLRGVNDDPGTLKQLFQGLLRMRGRIELVDLGKIGKDLPRDRVVGVADEAQVIAVDADGEILDDGAEPLVVHVREQLAQPLEVVDAVDENLLPGFHHAKSFR